MKYYSPMRSVNVAESGDKISVQGYSSRFRKSPTLAAYNPNTTYGLSYNPDHGKAARIKSIGKKILEKYSSLPSTEVKFQGVKMNSSNKPLLKVADEISDGVSNYGVKLSPLRLTNKLDIKLDHFSEVVKKRDSSVKVSSRNVDWLQNKEKIEKMQKLISGEFIPSMNQLYLYGRKAEKSIFERRGLSDSFNINY